MSLDATAKGLGEALAPQRGPNPTLTRRQGVVSAVNAGPPPTVDVTVGGIVIPAVRYLASYWPTVGDVVIVDFNGADPLVIGSTAPSQPLNLRMFGAGAALVGGSPPAIGPGAIPFKLQAATLVGSSDTNGYLNWTYPVAFPNGVLVVMATDGFTGAQQVRYINDAGFTTTSVAAIRFINTTTAAPATSFGPVRINLLAVGW